MPHSLSLDKLIDIDLLTDALTSHPLMPRMSAKNEIPLRDGTLKQLKQCALSLSTHRMHTNNKYFSSNYDVICVADDAGCEEVDFSTAAVSSRFSTRIFTKRSFLVVFEEYWCPAPCLSSNRSTVPTLSSQLP